MTYDPIEWPQALLTLMALEGTIIEVVVKTGITVAAGQQLVVMSAMKMETAVCAPVGGVVTQVAVEKNDLLDAGDLIVYIDSTKAADPIASLESDSEDE